MDELLDALRRGLRDIVEVRANELFLTRDGQCNKAQINEFERFAPCKIEKHGTGYLTGCIQYNDQFYYFG